MRWRVARLDLLRVGRDDGAILSWSFAMKRFVFLLACLVAGAGAHANPGESKARTELRQLGRAVDCTSDQQCKTLPVGAKSCGGPEAYMVYSTVNTSPEKANALAERYRKERELENKRSGMLSDCRVLMDPGAQCKAGWCQLGGPNGALAE
jgi:hypothetical protein